MKIDGKNAEILRILNKDGKTSNTELAHAVGLSPSACLRRVQELESSGVIEKYRAIIDREKLGFGFNAYVMVGLNEHTKRSQKEFEQAVSASEEVIECHNVTGSFEYILRVETTDLKAYKRFHTDRLGALPQVATISTHVVMDSPKNG